MRPRVADPIAVLHRRERRAWRRRERAIVAAHHLEVAAALHVLVGTPVLAVTTSPAGAVTITVPGWRVGLAGVSASARAALTAVARQSCHLSGAGRYGRFWWLTVGVTDTPAAPPVAVLGIAVRIHPAEGLTTHGERKEYSLR
jgi:hypothetical protein